MVIRGVWTLLGPVPMPWRAGGVLLLLIMASLLFLRALPWLLGTCGRLLLLVAEVCAGFPLWLEYHYVQSLRQRGLAPGRGAYLCGDALNGLLRGGNQQVRRLHEALGRLLKRRSHYAFFLAVPLIVPCMWYARPLLGKTPAATFVNQGFAWWNAFESYAQLGTWVSPARMRQHSSGAQVYVVQKGDQLKKIAEKFGVTIDEVVAANAQTYPSLATDRSKINIGWQLVIPAGR